MYWVNVFIVYFRCERFVVKWRSYDKNINEIGTSQVEEPPPAEKKEGEEDKNAGEQTNGPKNNEQQQSSEKPTEPMDVD